MYNNKAAEFHGVLAAHQQQTGGGQYPFLHPAPYMPAQFGMSNGSEMGSLIAMFAGPLMGAMAGPENFVPNLMPSQALMDQFAMRNYQKEMLQSSLTLSGRSHAPVAKMLAGLRGAITDEPMTQLNREQANTAAQFISHPLIKGMAGSVFGPETLEAALYGSKGDINMLGNAINKTGYFRSAPTGKHRPTAESLTAYTESLYADLYEPKGNLEELEADARKSRSALNPRRNQQIDRSQQRLKELANREASTIVSDDDVVSRMLGAENSDAKIARLYQKYVSGGKATTAEEKAKELIKFERAVKEADVLGTDEATIGQLRKEAEKAPLKRMRGFMAGQVGEMHKHLFEEGRLPQSLGDMTAAERFGVVAKTERDDETMRRLARTMAREELEKDATFKTLSSAQQERLIETKLPETRQTLEKTEKAAKKFAAGDKDAMSIEELEQQGGMNLLSVDADAKRVGTTLEKYAGSLAAIRQLFGDNGNPNAPVPMLIAAMNALTNNAMGQFEPGRIEAELRKMQSLAKETGTGLEQLAAISTNVTNQGRMFGLNDATSMQATTATLAALKVAQSDGSFQSNRFGSMNRGEYTDAVGRQIQSGAASNNARAMASMARMYEVDPDKYKDTELERAVQAYNDPNSGGRYIDPITGQEKNLFKDVGEFGPDAARRISLNSGGTAQDIDIRMIDPLTEEYAKKMGGFMTQPYEVEAAVKNFVTAPFVRKEMETDAKFQAMSEEDQERAYNAAGGAISRMLADTAQMNNADRVSFFKKNLELEIKQRLVDAGAPAAEAAAQAKSIAAQTNDPSKLDYLRAAEGATLRHQYGMTSVERGQYYGRNKAERIREEDARAQKQAAGRADADLGYETGPIQRVTDYFIDIGGSSEKVTMSGLMDAIMPTIKDKALAERYAKDMQPGFKRLAEMSKGVFVNDEYIDGLRAAGDHAALKALAGVDKEHRVISGKEMAAAREKVMKAELSDATGNISEEKVNAKYREVVRGSGAGMTTEEKLNELREHNTYKKNLDAEVMRKDKVATEDYITALARQHSKGHARKGHEQEAENIIKANAGLIYGKDADARQAATEAVFRQTDVKLDAKQRQKFHDLVGDASEVGQQRLKEEIDDLAISKDKKDTLQAILGAQQMASQYDLDQAGVKQTDSGVVDKTNIEANTVMLNATRYVDKDGKPLFEGGGGGSGGAGRAAPALDGVNSTVLERARQIVDENYSRVTSFGNSTAFTDAEVKDAASKLAEDLKINPKDAEAIMRGIQAERAQNSNQLFSGFFSERTPVADEKAKELSTAAQKIMTPMYTRKKQTLTEDDVDTAVKQLREQTGVEEEAARAEVKLQIERRNKNRFRRAGVGLDLSDLLFNSSNDREKLVDEFVRPEKSAPEIDAQTNDKKVQQRTERAAVKAATGIDIELMSKAEAARAVQDAGEDSRPRKIYDTAKLGVPETVTPAQQKVIDRVSKDPTGKVLAKEMTSIFDASTRDAVLTLPDEAAIDLFENFTPEAQEQGLKQLAEARNSGFLTQTQKENAERLHTAVSDHVAAKNSPPAEQSADVAAESTLLANDSLPGLSQTEAANYYEVLSKGLGADAAKKELAEMGFDPETFEAIEKYSNDALTEEFIEGMGLPEKLGGIDGDRFSELFEDPLTEKFTSRIVPALFGRGGNMPAVANEFLGQSHPSPVSDLIEAANEIHLAGMEDVRQRGFDHDVEMIARQLSPASPTNQTGVGMGAQQDQTLRVTGTLSLQGLQDVLLNARGQQSIPVEGSGAPIVIDPPNMYSSPSAPQKV
jgi:hypothetical protein